MSSDYIERLRAELLRAEPKPARRALKPLAIAAAAAAAVVLALVTIGDQAPDDTQTYQLSGGAQTARVLQERFAAADVDATVKVSGATVTVLADEDARPLLQPGRLAIYDWEASRIGTGPATFEQATARAARHGDAQVVRSDDGWYALAGPPALTNADLQRARAAEDPLTTQPAVLLDFTQQGQHKFIELTRTLAQRGADGVQHADPFETAQHFAIVVDDRIRALPFVNWRASPDGLRAAHISDDLTDHTATELAALLDSGPLP